MVNFLSQTMAALRLTFPTERFLKKNKSAKFAIAPITAKGELRIASMSFTAMVVLVPTQSYPHITEKPTVAVGLQA